MKPLLTQVGKFIGLVTSVAVLLAALSWGAGYVLEHYAITGPAQLATAELLRAAPLPLLYAGILVLMVALAAVMVRIAWSLSYVAENYIDIRKAETVRLAGRGSVVAGRLRAAGVPVLDTGPVIISGDSRPVVAAPARPADDHPSSRPSRKRTAAPAPSGANGAAS